LRRLITKPDKKIEAIGVSQDEMKTSQVSNGHALAEMSEMMKKILIKSNPQQGETRRGESSERHESRRRSRSRDNSRRPRDEFRRQDARDESRRRDTRSFRRSWSREDHRRPRDDSRRSSSRDDSRRRDPRSHRRNQDPLPLEADDNTVEFTYTYP